MRAKSRFARVPDNTANELRGSLALEFEASDDLRVREIARLIYEQGVDDSYDRGKGDWYVQLPAWLTDDYTDF